MDILQIMILWFSANLYLGIAMVAVVLVLMVFTLGKFFIGRAIKNRKYNVICLGDGLFVSKQLYRINMANALSLGVISPDQVKDYEGDAGLFRSAASTREGVGHPVKLEMVMYVPADAMTFTKGFNSRFLCNPDAFDKVN